MFANSRRVNGWAAGLTFIAVLAFAPAAIAVVKGDPPPTKGPVPSDAFVGEQGVDKSKVPDFIPALDRAGNQVGYISKNLAMPDNADAGKQVDIPVYADDLTTVVGRMVPGRGFVPAGKSAEDVPLLATSGSAEPAAPIQPDDNAGPAAGSELPPSK